jgi:hypothetical protein
VVARTAEQRIEDASEARVPGADIVGELMRAAWNGDEDTFDRLFDAWFAILYAEAWRRTESHVSAEALVREIALERICEAAERPYLRTLGRVAD